MTLRPGLPIRGEGSAASLFYAEPSMTAHFMPRGIN